MSEAKHTPGPWLVGLNTTQLETPIGEEFLGVGVASGRTICRVTRLLTEDEEDDSNASLIAAAPDLLEACKALMVFSADEIRLLFRLCNVNEDVKTGREMFEKADELEQAFKTARAAIAKATEAA